MALEAQDAVVRLRLEHAQKFRREADEAAAGLTKIQGAAKTLNKEAEAGALGGAAGKGGLLNWIASGKAAEHLAKFSGAAKQVAVSTQALSFATGFGIFEGIKEYTKATKALTEVQNLTQISRKETAELQKFALSTHLPAGPTDIYKAFYPAQSVLHNFHESLKAVTAAEEGAKIGGEGITATTDALLSYWEGNRTGVSSFNQEMELLLKTVGLAKMHLPELANIAKTGLFPLGQATARIPQQTILAALAAVSPTVGEGGTEQFATRFRTTLLKMVSQKGGALKAAKQLGFEKYEMGKILESGPLGLLSILERVEAAQGKLGTGKWNEALQSLFGGARGTAAITQLISQLPRFKENTAALMGVSQGELAKKLAVYEGTPAGKLEAAKAEGQRLLYTIGKEAMPILLEFLKQLKGIVGIFKELPTPLKKLLVGGLILGALVSPGAYLLSGLARMGGLVFRVAQGLALIAGGGLVRGGATAAAGAAEGGILGGLSSGAAKMKWVGLGKMLGGFLMAGLIYFAVKEAKGLPDKIFHAILPLQPEGAKSYGATKPGHLSYKGKEYSSWAELEARNPHTHFTHSGGSHPATWIEQALRKGVENAHLRLMVDGKELQVLGEHPKLNNGIDRRKRAVHTAR